MVWAKQHQHHNLLLSFCRGLTFISPRCSADHNLIDSILAVAPLLQGVQELECKGLPSVHALHTQTSLDSVAQSKGLRTHRQGAMSAATLSITASM